MGKQRLEAFSDGVIAIIITIMVLELRAPEGSTFEDLRALVPTFLSYALSFIYVGIYWNNHHHMFRLAESIDGAVLWANLHLLFWLSLLPFTTGWMGENHFARWPTMLYGANLLACAIAFTVLQTSIIRHCGRQGALAQAVASDLKGKISPAIYAASIPLTFANRWIAVGGYVIVALIWLVPDRRVEARFRAG